MLKIGKAVRAHGVRGDIKVLYGIDQSDLKSLESVIINAKEYEVEKISFGNGCAYLKLKGVNDMDTADALRGFVYVSDKHRPTLPAGTYYVDDLIGLNIVVDDVKVGVVKEILQYGAADVYSIEGVNGGKNFMFPHKIGVIINYDLKNKQLILSQDELKKVAVYEN
ncbi:MAG: 16S rRNA processing protein RimM [Clostridia bacterium]|nr:16S rRNA processing protein RimM [Clostridia bacterium]MBO7155828.1 16S rRNA processing protein RimM [Clostridia bacterium]